MGTKQADGWEKLVPGVDYEVHQGQSGPGVPFDPMKDDEFPPPDDDPTGEWPVVVPAPGTPIPDNEVKKLKGV